MSVNLNTVVSGKRTSIALENGLNMMTRIFCSLCFKHKDRLRALRNYSSSFVDGITHTSLKKDNVSKHQKSEMHKKAVNMDRQPSANDIYESTPLG